MIILGVVFSRFLQTLRLERGAFIWMDLNDRATGDAVILVVVTQILISLGLGTPLFTLIDPVNLVRVLVDALLMWLVYSGAVYMVVRYVLGAPSSYAIYLRITGFAYPVFTLVIVVSLLIINTLLAFIISGVWFIVIVSNGLMYIVDIPIQKATLASVGGFVLLLITQEIFGFLPGF